MEPTIGLEIHAELATKSKMFCSCKNDPDEKRPNQNVCPVCLAHPGTLPVINKEAVQKLLQIGQAVGGTIATFTEFDRKSYFYPDIPKGYQISQYQYPFVQGGSLAGVALTRVHLEEDTARSTHGGNKSLVDFNRAGVPLMELVTEPVIHDSKTAGAFARELQLLLRSLGAGEANLEKGEMRIEANISVGTKEKLGTKVEVKNLNSFRSVENAIEYEIKRQTKAIESGEKVVQETRGWDEQKQETFHQRFKEGSADYRYFPEPDLPKIILDASTLEAIVAELPEQKRKRYTEIGIRKDDIETLVQLGHAADFFDTAVQALTTSKEHLLAVNYFLTDLSADPGRMSAAEFGTVIHMLSTQKLSSRGAKDLLIKLKSEGGNPEELATQLGLIQIEDVAALETAIKAVLEQHPTVVADFKQGKQAALQFLIGMAMKQTKGAGNPEKIRGLLLEQLN